MKNRSKLLILSIGDNRFEFNSVNDGMDALRKLGIKFGKKYLNKKSGNIIGRHYVDGKCVQIVIPYEQPQYKPYKKEKKLPHSPVGLKPMIGLYFFPEFIIR